MTTEERGSREKPINREPDADDFVNRFITPLDKDYLFDRNHGPIPDVSAETHTVTIDGLVEKTLTLSPSDLATRFPQHKVIAALQCAGNRRHQMRERLKEVQGIDWFDKAILNAEWEGPLVRDVLRSAGVKEGDDADAKSAGEEGEEELHVAFACYQQKTQEDEWYGGSIPLKRAMNKDNEVVLALKMNGKPLTRNHGYPVRALVPGIIGARSVKWLDRITISPQQSPNFYQRHDYKILPPEATDADSAAQFWDKVPPMMDNKINSVVGVPGDGDTITAAQPTSDSDSTTKPHSSDQDSLESEGEGKVHIKGYAIPQGSSGPVVRVEVSTDEGRTWHDATLGPATRYSWVLWEALVPIQRGREKRIFSRATDREGNTQREERSEWNLRGVGYNGYESTVNLTIV